MAAPAIAFEPQIAACLAEPIFREKGFALELVELLNGLVHR